jgi:hypothetical protein
MKRRRWYKDEDDDDHGDDDWKNDYEKYLWEWHLGASDITIILDNGGQLSIGIYIDTHLESK